MTGDEKRIGYERAGEVGTVDGLCAASPCTAASKAATAPPSVEQWRRPNRSVVPASFGVRSSLAIFVLAMCRSSRRAGCSEASTRDEGHPVPPGWG